MKKTSIDDLDNAINDALKDYGIEVENTVYGAAMATAKDTVKELKRTSPKRTGQYAKSWRVTKVYNSRRAARGGIRMYIHNAKHYRLTHLLEKGHKKRGSGGRVKAYPHIEKAEEHARREFQKKLESRIKGL